MAVTVSVGEGYHLDVQGKLHSVVQPAQSHDRISIQRAGQDALPAVHQVIRHRPTFNLTVPVCRQQPRACTHTLNTVSDP